MEVEEKNRRHISGRTIHWRGEYHIQVRDAGKTPDSGSGPFVAVKSAMLAASRVIIAGRGG